MEANTKEGKYVHLIGPAQIKTNNNRLEVTLLNNDRTPINSKPVILDQNVAFVSIHLVAEFFDEQFENHQDILTNSKHSFVEVRTLKDPAVTILPETSEFDDCMTSTDPPCRNTVK
ncbi:hypothetical protein [Spirosoma litoris]